MAPRIQVELNTSELLNKINGFWLKQQLGEIDRLNLSSRKAGILMGRTSKCIRKIAISKEIEGNRKK